uniref:V-type proton ATPase subunit S1/VOA1 transmembrane domain-containing protein n=1 Tax=Trichobilharzia regenti TaxID=157069 RepID=A0AA85KPN4_TRIRE|nr:unnamed protein product [Trichobilharzia regenti]
MILDKSVLILALCGALLGLCTAQDSNYTYFNVSGCLAFFARSISIKFQVGTKVTVVPIPASSIKLSTQSKCSDAESVLAFTASTGEITSLSMSLQFTKSGRYWGVSGSSANITCKAESDSCFNLPDSPVAMGWAEAPLGLGYKCTKPPVASIMAKLNSGKSVSIQFSSVQIEPFSAKNGVFGDVTDCVGYFSIGVWSSLIVSILLVSILTYGLVMLASVQPTEIYDDPKKKMIQLGADK